MGNTLEVETSPGESRLPSRPRILLSQRPTPSLFVTAGSGSEAVASASNMQKNDAFSGMR